MADEGDSFDFDQKQQDLGPYTPSHTVDQLSEGGLGLYLMETLMDEVRVQNHSGVTVAMTKYLNGERVDHDTTIKTTKLTKDEVDRLISDYQTKQDEQAQETLVRVYTNLVDMLAKNTQKAKASTRISARSA